MVANPNGCVIPQLAGAYVMIGGRDDKRSLVMPLLTLVLGLCNDASCCALRGAQLITATAAFTGEEPLQSERRTHHRLPLPAAEPVVRPFPRRGAPTFEPP